MERMNVVVPTWERMQEEIKLDIVSGSDNPAVQTVHTIPREITL